MNCDRRQFSLGVTAALIGLTASPGAHKLSDFPGARPEPTRPPYLFKNPTFEMIFLTSLGRAYHSGGNVGKVLLCKCAALSSNSKRASLK